MAGETARSTGEVKRAALIIGRLEGDFATELHSLPWNLQAEKAPSHLQADVTEAQRDGGGEGGGTSAPRKTSCMGCTLPGTVRGVGTY